MREAIATYTARAAEKLRGQRLIASAVQVFMHTNRFNGDPPYANHGDGYARAFRRQLLLINATVRVAQRFGGTAFAMRRRAWSLSIFAATEQATAQFFPSRDPARSAALMQALDAVNRRWPGYAASGWHGRKARLVDAAGQIVACLYDVL